MNEGQSELHSELPDGTWKCSGSLAIPCDTLESLSTASLSIASLTKGLFFLSWPDSLLLCSCAACSGKKEGSTGFDAWCSGVRRSVRRSSKPGTMGSLFKGTKKSSIVVLLRIEWCACCCLSAWLFKCLQLSYVIRAFFVSRIWEKKAANYLMKM